MPDRPLPCPQCGGDSAVADSRPTHSQWIRRRRRCHKCNHRFSTIELPVEILDSYADVATSKDITLLIRLLAQARDLAEKIRDLPELPHDYDDVRRPRD